MASFKHTTSHLTKPARGGIYLMSTKSSRITAKLDLTIIKQNSVCFQLILKYTTCVISETRQRRDILNVDQIVPNNRQVGFNNY
jgi:hypothetical protein